MLEAGDHLTASAFPIVGIGASAGGLDAFHGFFDRGFVIVTFGSYKGPLGENIKFGPTGNLVGDGGGAMFTLPSSRPKA